MSLMKLLTCGVNSRWSVCPAVVSGDWFANRQVARGSLSQQRLRGEEARTVSLRERREKRSVFNDDDAAFKLLGPAKSSKPELQREVVQLKRGKCLSRPPVSLPSLSPL